MADAIFEHERLAEIYDLVDGDRKDLDAYLALVDELRAESVLDIGCGTGNFACLLARGGKKVVGVDPAGASLAVARKKQQAEKVRWLQGDATTLPPLQVDLAVMTGNVAQVFLTDEEWSGTLHGAKTALRPGGHLVFESRDPARKRWLTWDREHSYQDVEASGIGRVETWVELTDLSLPFVSFRHTFVFERDDTVLTSFTTLRFRELGELTASVEAAGFVLDDVRDAPDRPGLEFLLVCTRP